MIAHKGSGFGSYVILNNLRQWRNVVNLKKIGAGFFSLTIFNGYVNEKKKIPFYLHFRCRRVHIISSLIKIGVSYTLQPLLLKQEMEHDEIF